MTYDFPTTELGMVQAAREVLLVCGTPEELATNARLIEKYTKRRPARVVMDDGLRGAPGSNPRPYDSTVPEAVLGVRDTTPDDGFPTPVAPVRTSSRTASDKQMWLAGKLMDELKTHNPDAHATLDGIHMRMADMSIGDASAFITSIREALAGPAGAPAPVVDVPAPKANVWAEWRRLATSLVEFGGHTGARFAVDTDDGAVNSLAFWWISPSRDGNRFYLRQVIGGQGPVRVRMSPEAMIAIAQKIIDAGPEAALTRFGQELGMCGDCGRELTNDESRAYGRGPWCRTHR